MPAPVLATPPHRVCLLRLSAIGDCCHVVPLLRRLQDAWPGTQFTWVIGRQAAPLMSLIPEVRFVVLDTGSGLAACRRLRTEVRQHGGFDLLLHLQLSFRASMAAALIPAPVKLGFDRARARELQWLFTNAHVAPRQREHVLESFQGFADALGVPPAPPRWDIAPSDEAQSHAAGLIPDSRPTLLISACSSHALRNWAPGRYAAVADHAADRHGMRVILCGGSSTVERRMAGAIVAAVRVPVLNQVGLGTLPQLLALMSRATVLLTPDSGPAHMATMVGLPVIGLYAATRAARSGPYRSRRWCVDVHEVAARRFLGRSAADIPWTTKIERPGVMDLIEAGPVIAKLDEMLALTPQERLS